MAGPSEAQVLEEAAGAILDDMAAAGPDSGLAAFHALLPDESLPRVAAVDGGSTVVLDVRSAGLYCVRAGYSLRDSTGRFLDRTPTRASRTVTRHRAPSTWDRLRAQYAWGVELPTPTIDNSRLVPQLAETERALAEYDAARRALHELRRGEILLLDGSLDEDERLATLRESLLDRAREQAVDVAALSKDSSLSLGGVLPLPVEVEELALTQKIVAPWWTDVTGPLGRDDRPFRTLVARFDARAPAFRIDVAGDPAALLRRLLALCDDAAYPGYPYPLARIHQRVHFEGGEAIDLRRHLEGIVARRRGHRLSSRLFGKGRDVLQLAD